ncbi:hypothetical protein BH11ACT5_BH11ACT5_15190 [soil metagenome]
MQAAAARPFQLLASDGPKSFTARVLAKIARHLQPQTPNMLVATSDASGVDFTEPAPWAEHPWEVTHPHPHLAWIMSPPGKESGGHQNLFRFIDFAEKAGYRCSILLYTANGPQASITEVRSMLASTDAYPEINASIAIYDSETGVGPGVDAIVATGWETAYPAFADHSLARRLYFVQDFEPSFYPTGSESLFAENTYRFGFFGITAGGWLASKLHNEYGMQTEKFDFAVDPTIYNLTNREPRTEAFFYARPVTARRAFDFGITALTDFARLKPDVTINLAGWNVSNWHVPFKYRNLASLEITELNPLYNRCAVGLVLSLTNMSLLPLELMASGVAPVVNDGPNNRMVSDNPYIEFVPPSPLAIARRMAEVVDRPDAVERSIAMSASASSRDWNASGVQFVSALDKALRG